jgi:hypothetical protein
MQIKAPALGHRGLADCLAIVALIAARGRIAPAIRDSVRGRVPSQYSYLLKREHCLGCETHG